MAIELDNHGICRSCEKELSKCATTWQLLEAQTLRLWYHGWIWGIKGKTNGTEPCRI